MDKLKAHFKKNKNTYKAAGFGAIAGVVLGLVRIVRDQDNLIDDLREANNGLAADANDIVNVNNQTWYITYDPDVLDSVDPEHDAFSSFINALETLRDSNGELEESAA